MITSLIVFSCSKEPQKEKIVVQYVVDTTSKINLIEAQRKMLLEVSDSINRKIKKESDSIAEIEERKRARIFLLESEIDSLDVILKKRREPVKVIKSEKDLYESLWTIK
jgi:predicted transglutaminase-like cysteine proteinase